MKIIEKHTSKRALLEIVEESMIVNAHRYGWSKFKTAHAFSEGIVRVQMRLNAETHDDVYKLVFCDGFDDSVLRESFPVLYDFNYPHRLSNL